MPKDLEARLRKLEQDQPNDEGDQAWADGILHALSVAYGDGEPIDPIPAKVLRKWIEEALDQAYGPTSKSTNSTIQPSKRKRRRK